MNTREIKFRACPGFEDSDYIVGSDGTVHGKKGVLKSFLNEDGYPSVTLIVKGKRYRRRIHRLIAEAFISNPLDKPQVNHKNSLRDDNRVENLEWVTSKENTIHGWLMGRKQTDKQKSIRSTMSKGENNPKAKITREKAEDIRAWRKLGWELKLIAKAYKLSIAQVGAICSNKFWKNENN